MSFSTASQLFAVVGAAVALKAASDLTSFVWFHFLSPPRYHRYLHGDAPYALVTGATDGIGEAIAKELYSKGFNLIIHGRNPEKLRKVQDAILSSPSPKKNNVRIWVADASVAEIDFASALKEWEDIEITLVIHNVGGAKLKGERFDAIPEETLFSELHLNATFPWLLTRALLPKLRLARGPVELVFVGSVTADLSMPGLNPYGATKAFIKQLSGAIAADEQFRKPTNVTASYLNVGGVSTNNRGGPPSLFEPSAARFAKSVVAKVGSGRRVVVPWVWHAAQFWITGFVPESVLMAGLADTTEKEIVAQDKRA
ncbi:NAD(P)-binding protein [Irpex rosettiformis]|uniref:NAD(P)-binding protein n=1 Tax=Irpex rosettiformis TaxID=378272 RepID=A0ACB8U2C1_9APHY|nr:NAD(P)-binding protein [Irpex rosettiformis]